MPTTYPIIKGNQYMDASLYTGNGGTQSIVNAAGFSPDLVWVKQRNGTGWNILTDSVRGANKQLYSNATNSEGSDTALITALNSNGFSVGYNGGTDVNGSGSTYVGWQWRGSDSSPVTNTAGSITSTVSANTTAGFSVVTYTGTGAAATIGHGLSAVPKMIIVKDRSTTNPWPIYHVDLGVQKYIFLNASDGAYTNLANYWSATAPSSTVFGIGAYGGINTNGNSYVAYCWSEVPGFSKFGSYAGNGSADGPFIYTGFRPEFVMLKRSDSSGNDWDIMDATRDTSNVAIRRLYPNRTLAEENVNGNIDILSNGFKIRNTDAGYNASGATYVYMAFAEMPFKYANAR